MIHFKKVSKIYQSNILALLKGIIEYLGGLSEKKLISSSLLLILLLPQLAFASCKDVVLPAYTNYSYLSVPFLALYLIFLVIIFYLNNKKKSVIFLKALFLVLLYIALICLLLYLVAITFGQFSQYTALPYALVMYTFWGGVLIFIIFNKIIFPILAIAFICLGYRLKMKNLYFTILIIVSIISFAILFLPFFGPPEHACYSPSA